MEVYEVYRIVDKRNVSENVILISKFYLFFISLSFF